MATERDRTRPLKLESTASGGTQNDESWTEVDIGQDYLDGRGITLQVAGATVTTSDASTYISRPVAGSLAFTDQLSGTLSLEQLLTSVAGKPGSHAALADIIHFLPDGPGDGWASGAVCVEGYTGPLLTSSTWYTDAAQSRRIIALAVTYTGPLPATFKYSLYDATGALVRTLTDTCTYNGPLLQSRTRTWGTT